MGNETIFREKAVERMSSPDQLNDYVKLSDPGMWFLLAAIVVVLAGACIFGAVGHIDSTVPGVGICVDGKMTAWVKREYGDSLQQELKVKVGGNVYDARMTAAKPVEIPADADSYALYLGGMEPGQWVYEVTVDGVFDDGAYDAQVITEQISPLAFLFGANE